MAALLLLAALPAAKAATITIVNLDGPNEGFNDPTPVTSEGGNAATTRGAQRLAVFQRAAEILGAQLQSGIEIKVGAQFDSFNADPDFGQPACSTGGGILGFAGPGTFSRDFPNAPVAGTWYPIALAEARAGTNLNGTANEVNASFNSDVDAACLGPGTRFWYGTVSTSPSGNLIALLPVVLHELSHGLGFLTLVCTSPSGCGSGNPQGSFASGFPDIWTNFLANSANPSLTWRNMTVAQRAASVTADPNTVWTGSNVTAAIPSVGISAGLSAGLLRMHAPAAFQPGSSISHFSSAASPNLLMEPAINTNLFAQLDMTIPLFRDIGWLQASNQSPSLTLDAGSASYTENGAPILIAPSATAGDADGNWSGGRLSVAISAGASADDRIGIGATGGISVSGSNVNDGATTFATLNASGGEVANTATLTATFNGSATNARVQALARAIQFRNVSDAPATSARTVAFTLVDGASASAPATRTITVAAVNDPPTLNLPVSVGITEDLAGTVVPVSFVDPDAGTGSVVATFSVPAGTLSATSAAGVTVGGSATARTLAGTLDAINTFLSLGALSYTGAANANGAVTLTVSINDQGNTGSGGVRIASDTTTLQIAPANDAPTVSAPASLALLGGASIGVSPVSYADPDAPFGGNVVATYAAPNGTFAATSGGGVTVAGSGTGTLTLTGPLASINSFVGATPVQYTAGSASGVVPLTLSINDQGNTGGAPLGGSRTVNATVTAEGTIFVNGFEG
jgi:hypothetical protein